MLVERDAKLPSTNYGMHIPSAEIVYRYAEVLQESRGFTPEEEEWFDTGAKSAYAEFRNKAAQSRGMTNEQMEELAQVI